MIELFGYQNFGSVFKITIQSILVWFRLCNVNDTISWDGPSR